MKTINSKKILSIVMMAAMSIFGQIKVNHEWPIPIQRKFVSFMQEKHDTVLIYYMYAGPWTNLPDSCKNIFSFWILWGKNGQYFAQELPCMENDSSKNISISSVPFDYLRQHFKDLKRKAKLFKPNKKKKQIRFLPPVITDGSEEYLVFMTSTTNYSIRLAEFQRTDAWRNSEFPWINPTIEIIDTIRYELYRK